MSDCEVGVTPEERDDAPANSDLARHSPNRHGGRIGFAAIRSLPRIETIVLKFRQQPIPAYAARSESNR